MRILFLILLSFFFLTSNSQNLELVKNQWEAILAADNPREKIMRSCRMSKTLMLNNYDFDQKRLVRDTDLSQIDGVSDLIDEEGRIRWLSWFFEIEAGKIQYSFNSACGYLEKAGYRFNMNGCYNEHEIDCRECDRGKGQNNDWEGTYYTSMNAFYEDSLLIVRLEGLQFGATDTLTVQHYYSVSPNCKMIFLNNNQPDAVR